MSRFDFDSWYGKLIIAIVAIVGIILVTKGCNRMRYNNTKVYICTSNKKTFHVYDWCSSLNDCNGNIFQVKLPEAHTQGYKVCEDCYDYYEYESEKKLEESREKRNMPY